MSTLYYVNDDLSELNVRYISEPILAVAASLIMSKQENITSILNNLNNYIQSLNLSITGAIGEIIAELILLLAYDRATINLDNIGRAITVESFLISLVGETYYMSKIEKNTTY